MNYLSRFARDSANGFEVSICIQQRNHVTITGDGSAHMIFARGFECDQHMWGLIAPAFLAPHRVLLSDHVGSGQSDLRASD